MKWLRNHHLRDLEDMSKIPLEDVLRLIKDLWWLNDRYCCYWEMHSLHTSLRDNHPFILFLLFFSFLISSLFSSPIFLFNFVQRISEWRSNIIKPHFTIEKYIMDLVTSSSTKLLQSALLRAQPLGHSRILKNCGFHAISNCGTKSDYNIPT